MAVSRRILLARGRDALILIPVDSNRTGGVARRCRRATIWLLSRGIYPSPSAVNMRMRGEVRDCLNGVETRERNAVLAERGVPKMRRPGIVERCPVPWTEAKA